MMVEDHRLAHLAFFKCFSTISHYTATLQRWSSVLSSPLRSLPSPHTELGPLEEIIYGNFRHPPPPTSEPGPLTEITENVCHYPPPLHTELGPLEEMMAISAITPPTPNWVRLRRSRNISAATLHRIWSASGDHAKCTGWHRPGGPTQTKILATLLVRVMFRTINMGKNFTIVVFIQAKCRIIVPFTSISCDKIVYMFITTSTVCMHMSNLLKTSTFHASSEPSYSCL